MIVPSDRKSRIGCSTITYCQLPLEDALKKIAAQNLSKIDIAVIPTWIPHIDPFSWSAQKTDDLQSLLEELNLTVSTLNIETSGLAARSREEPVEFVESVLPIAKALGAYTITLAPGPQTPSAQWTDAARQAAQRFRRLADSAEAHEIKISIEAPHTFTLAENYDEAARLFSIIDDPRIGCTFDTSHGQRNDKRSITEGLKAVGAPIYHVHLRDAFWKDCSLTPGKGACEFGPFFDALDAMDYSGDYNLELEAIHADPDEECTFAREYLGLVLDKQPLPEKFVQWKDRRAQIKRALIDIVKNPKTFVVSQPALKNALKPLAHFVRDHTPRIYTRYEMGWKTRFSLGGVDQVRYKASGAAPSGAGSKARVGILGCGNIGFNMQGPAFARVDHVDVCGVCDVIEESADKLATKLGCNAYTDLEELISREKPELVTNCTKEWLHYDTTMALLDNGIHVFCEKIMADSLERGEEMVNKAREKGLMLAVNYNWRFLPGVVRLKQIKDSGKLGPLLSLRFLCHSWVWNHVLDLADYLGGEVTTVYANTRTREDFYFQNPWSRFAHDLFYYPDHYALATLETKDRVGISITGGGGWDPESCLFNVDAIFEKGIVTLSGVRSMDAIGVMSCTDKHLNVAKGLRAKNEPRTFAITFQRAIDHFMNAYTQQTPVSTSGEQGLRVMRMEHAIVESARTGERVTLE